ncbi:sodium channel modifier 1 [Pelobates cultripes]|uniref:Sodium channel modifier 1 n=1 Tax=Pelobates cultripes TaxID=61616 RepID=A0AAD1WSP3_PELCU|nr:sodium channel modifier 1 [Pelobates cultripes]
MSFKREGDDGSQLNVLKKRRVADLLASFIPEDEALLIKNGSYACTVCSHRPVFDTIDMLSVHRNGKKHLASLQWFYGKKNNFKNEVQKRQHERFVRAEETGEQMPIGPAPLLMQTRKITQHALLKATPYNSCCSRNRSADTSRKISAFGASPAPDTVPNLPQRTTETSQPGQGDRSLDVEKQTTECPKPSTGHKKSGAKRSESEADSTDPERTRAIHHYLLLKSSGWIPNRSGQWVKDPNVEFDSDEEEPPVLPHPDT